MSDRSVRLKLAPSGLVVDRDEVNGTVRSLHGQGRGIRAIVRATGVSRQTVCRTLAGTRDGVFRSRSSTLGCRAARLSAERDGGCRNGAELWRRLRSAGCRSGQRVATGWMTRRRRSTASSSGRPRHNPACAARPDHRAPADAGARLQVGRGVAHRDGPENDFARIVAARDLADRFSIVAAKNTDDLTAWLDEAAGSDLASFASGVRDDGAAIVQPWSSGETEGQVARLKLAKRRMYGRASVDLKLPRFDGHR